MKLRSKAALARAVQKAVSAAPVIDLHTHLYPAGFGAFLLKGVDELLTYHYLAAETLRVTAMTPKQFYALGKREQADLVWQSLFIQRSPLSEACRGVVTTLEAWGLDPASRKLDAFRKKLDAIPLSQYIDRVFALAGVKQVVMSNDPFDREERKLWSKGAPKDKRFLSGMRLDKLLLSWDSARLDLWEWGYKVGPKPVGKSLDEVRRFVGDEFRKMGSLYAMASTPPAFEYPGRDVAAQVLDGAILPVCRDLKAPFALMMGVKRQVNPDLKMAGDGVGWASIESLEALCARNPGNKFLATMLSRENQHGLAVAARKFKNLMPFGCWWFVNTPGQVADITRLRLELLGTSFIPQHSDARVLEQLVYKWKHARKAIGSVLAPHYAGLLEAGWVVDEDELARDVDRLFSGNFLEFLGR